MGNSNLVGQVRHGDHILINNKTETDQHPISAITNLQTALDSKQATLISGENIKTIHSKSILGSGNLVLAASDILSQSQLEAVNSGITSTKTAQIEANTSTINTHIDNNENPHNVNKAQVDLSEVDNTSDLDKPISLAQAAVNAELTSKIEAISARGRYLSTWDCTTGLPGTYPIPTAYPYTYTYKSGDYFIISNVPATGTLYRPDGSAITKESAEASWIVGRTEELASGVAVNDTYLYDNNAWTLLHGADKEVTFANIAGQPTDNSNLATALQEKQNTLTAAQLAAANSGATFAIITKAKNLKVNGQSQSGTGSITLTQDNIGDGGTYKRTQNNYTSEEKDKVAAIPADVSSTNLVISENSLKTKYVVAGLASGSSLGERATAEGYNVVASGNYGHAEGVGTSAIGLASHAGGIATCANTVAQCVVGTANNEDPDQLFIVGNGTYNTDYTASTKSNAFTVSTTGEGWFARDVYVGSTSGTSKDTGSRKLVVSPIRYISSQTTEQIFVQNFKDGTGTPAVAISSDGSTAKFQNWGGTITWTSQAQKVTKIGLITILFDMYPNSHSIFPYLTINNQPIIQVVQAQPSAETATIRLGNTDFTVKAGFNQEDVIRHIKVVVDPAANVASIAYQGGAESYTVSNYSLTTSLLNSDLIVKLGGVETNGWTAKNIKISQQNLQINLEDNAEYYLENIERLDIIFPSSLYHQAYMQVSLANNFSKLHFPTGTKVIGTPPIFSAGETWVINIKNNIIYAQKVDLLQ